MAAEIDTDNLTGNAKIIAEAKKRFNRCEQWEAQQRKAFLDDVKFANGDSENGWQWPNEIRRNRDIDERPCLTVNKINQHNLQIENDARQNKPAVRIIATGGGATKDSADVFEGIVRHIEYKSNAQEAYDTAMEFQVEGGIGYWRLVTDYVDDTSFDQEIKIMRIKDPMTVYLDSAINTKDGSDANYGFIFEDMPKDMFKMEYPEHQDLATIAPLGNNDTWVQPDHVRVAEYFRRTFKKDTLIAIQLADGSANFIYKSQITPDVYKQLMAQDPKPKTRTVQKPTIEWYKIAGDEVIETKEWMGKYIPIIRVVGREKIINGELDRKGHTRMMKDPQRIYNYWNSSAVEQVALQSKTPYVAPARAIEGLETYWHNANRVNYSVLPFNDRDDEGNPIGAPVRQNPPVLADAYINGLTISSQDMQFVSGQYEASFGQKSNEQSGRAINERQRKGDNSTYHFIDSFGDAIRYTGVQLIDLIPKIYDTKRVVMILAEDGVTQTPVTLDPDAKAALQESQQKQQASVEAAAKIFNPNVGKYDVRADVGPGYATRRQDAFNALSQIAMANQELMTIIGDLLFKNADFPGADEIAERMKRMVPAQALGAGSSPELQQAMEQQQALQAVVANLVQQLGESRIELKNKDKANNVDEYKALTDRLKVLMEQMVNPKDIAKMLHDMMLEEQKNHNQLMTQQPNVVGEDEENGGSTQADSVNGA